MLILTPKKTEYISLSLINTNLDSKVEISERSGGLKGHITNMMTG